MCVNAISQSGSHYDVYTDTRTMAQTCLNRKEFLLNELRSHIHLDPLTIRCCFCTMETSQSQQVGVSVTLGFVAC